jgi:hypothetical protein
MRVFVANNTGRESRRLAATFPGRVGLLISPGGWRRPDPGFPYAIDNGAFACWRARHAFDANGFLSLLDRVKHEPIRPQWIAVPDVVMDRDATPSMWRAWSGIVGDLGAPLAFVVQDGMKAIDVPAEAEAIFVGGSTPWKWLTLPMWCEVGRRVHLGRVNTNRRLRHCARLGVESCDGTGYFRGNRKQLDAVCHFLADTHCVSDPVDGPMQPRFASGW